MKKLTDKQKQLFELYKNSTKYATAKELFITGIWWNIFRHKKFLKLLENLEKGMHFKVAYNNSKT